MAQIIELDSRRGPQLEDGFTCIANELLEAVAIYGFTARELRLVLVVIRRTYGYRRLTAPLSARSLGKACGMPREAVIRTVNGLVSRRIFTRITTGTSSRVPAQIGLNKYYRDWLPASGALLADESRDGCQSDTREGFDSRRDGCQNDTREGLDSEVHGCQIDTREGADSQVDGCQSDTRDGCQDDTCTGVKTTPVLYIEEIKDLKERKKENSKEKNPPYPPGACAGHTADSNTPSAGALRDAAFSPSPQAAPDLTAVPPIEPQGVAQECPPDRTAPSAKPGVATPTEPHVPGAVHPQRAADTPADTDPQCGAGAADGFSLVPPAVVLSASAASDKGPARQGRRTAPRGAVTAAVQQRFERFWLAYPKKRSRQQALRAFAKLDPDDALVDTLIAAVERARNSSEWRKSAGQYIPYPASWLNAQGWLDELQPEAYTETQMAVMAAYNSILGAGGWPEAVTAPYSAHRASAIDEFVTFSPKPDMPARYFTHCLQTLNVDGEIGFDALIRKNTYLKIREGVSVARRRGYGDAR